MTLLTNAGSRRRMLRATVLMAGAAAPTASAQWTVVILHPAGATESYATGAGDGQQVGYALVDGAYHASLWTDTAASWVDLNPAGMLESHANGAASGLQAGFVYVGGQPHASVWSGTAVPWVDLNPAGADASHVWGFSPGKQAGSAFVGGAYRASCGPARPPRG